MSSSSSTSSYMEAASSKSLREGLAEYRERNPALLDPAGIPADVAELFRQHDAGHVVFGCDTSLRGETLIDTWTVLGTTAGVRGYMQYFKHPEVNQIFSDVGYGRIVIESLRWLPDVLRVLARSRGLARRWPWDEYERYLDRPLVDIRLEFSIRIV